MARTLHHDPRAQQNVRNRRKDNKTPMSTRELLSRDDHRSALLVVDVINHFDFPDGQQLLSQARRMAKPLEDLLRFCRSKEIPIVYVNDNFGDWRRNFNELIESCRTSDSVTAFVTSLQPDSTAYYILKPNYSGFYQTSLEVLLRALGVNNLILTGLATDRCIEFTAKDAYMRRYGIYIPADCCAAVQQKFHSRSIDYMGRILGADTASWEM
jgi:nicotinamidase-related amidase